MIHENNMNHFNEIILNLVFKIAIPFLFMYVIVMPLQPVTGKILVELIDIVLLHKVESLAKCCRHNTCQSDA